MSTSSALANTARSLGRFIDASPSPFHAVQTVVKRLEAAGFTRLRECDPWSPSAAAPMEITPGGRYFVVRNGSAIVAFAAGQSATSGFHIVGTHTDSPCPRIRARSTLASQGYVQVGVETYGGGLWHTWFDRDLTVAGQVVLNDGSSHLVHFDKPLLRIPTLAIHLDREVSSKGFQPNFEEHLQPMLGLAKTPSFAENPASGNPADVTARHEPALLRMIAEQISTTAARSVSAADIAELELCLADTQPASTGGLDEAFLFAPRLDNLASCYAGLEGLLGALDAPAPAAADRDVTRVLAMFDHEEVGSTSTVGADSTYLSSILRRITGALARHQAAADATAPVPPAEELFAMAVARSFVVSADMAHAVHPNYSGKHAQSGLRPAMNAGIVIKYNGNQRYATNGTTAQFIRAIARRGDVPVQEVAVRNDSPCGSTIGPICTSQTGIATADIGIPQLSMHSIREVCGAYDVENYVQFMKAFYAGGIPE